MILASLFAFVLAAATPVPVQRIDVVASYPHDSRAFTQGLFFRNGHLYESTGHLGRSTVRKVQLADGKIVQTARIPATQFGEGSTEWNGEIVSLTWQDGVGHRWDAATLKPRGTFRYDGEGWGLTHDGRTLIMSDGSAILSFRDPKTFAVVRRLPVTADGRPVALLNELEWIKGEIWANVWQTDRIARIDPKTGAVKAWIDLSGLEAQAGGSKPDFVLNGIAHDAKRDRIFVTGKQWNKLFEIRVQPSRQARAR